jgi:hypothetical protein
MMKHLITCVVVSVLAAGTARGDQFVRGYLRRDGRYAQPYWRTDRNDTVTDNHSFRGNRNPSTGAWGRDRYSEAPSSPFYDPSRSLLGGTSYGLPSRASRRR